MSAAADGQKTIEGESRRVGISPESLTLQVLTSLRKNADSSEGSSSAFDKEGRKDDMPGCR